MLIFFLIYQFPFFDPHNPWHLAVAASTLFYSGSLLAFALGLIRLKADRVGEQPFVSVVVAARNEERHLEALLGSLLAQEYPAYEVIVVNDCSTDRTPEILADFQKRDARLKRVDVERLADDLSPKQNALALGVGAGRGEILCLTDADCLPGPQWLASTVACFSADVGIVAGYSPFSSAFLPTRRKLIQRTFDAFVRYEEFRKAVRSAAGAAFGKAWGCTGRNLAFRRAAFEEVGGYHGVPRSPSGDDMLLLQQIGKKTRWRFSYLVSPENFVPTAPPESFGELLRQGIRQAFGVRHFPRAMRLLLFLLFASHLVVTAALIVAAFSPENRMLGVSAFAFKCGMDAVLLLSSAARFREWGLAASFLLMEPLCLLYYACLLVLVVFKLKPVEWKP